MDDLTNQEILDANCLYYSAIIAVKKWAAKIGVSPVRASKVITEGLKVLEKQEKEDTQKKRDAVVFFGNNQNSKP